MTAYLFKSRYDFQQNLSNSVDTGIHTQDPVRNHFSQKEARRYKKDEREGQKAKPDKKINK